MGIFTTNKFSKITTAHSEPLSDKEILDHMVSVNKAKRHYSANDYSEFMEIYRSIASENKPFPTNLTRFWDRAFAIAYTFEILGFSYEDIYAKATVYNTYIETKESYDQLVETIVSNYYNAIENIIDRCYFDGTVVHQYAICYLQMLCAAFLDAGRFECKTDYLQSLINVVTWFYQKIVEDRYEVNNIAQNTYFDALASEYDDAYDNNDSVEGLIEEFTKRFLSIIGADPNNNELYEIMRDGTFEMEKIAFQEAENNLAEYKNITMRRG